MCGFAGIVEWGKAPDRLLLERMHALLRHRGPDAEGFYADGPIALAHRRLSIIDLDARSNQPMEDASGEYVLVYNGELYNYRSLRDELIALGHRFRTQSDTEVVLSAYKQWGRDCVTHFNGMFALALWHKPGQSLFLARDRAGEKPLFYKTLPGGGIAFASELSALRLLGSDVSRESLHHYLQFGYSPPQHAMLEGVEKLLPAHVLELTRDSLKTSAYWDITESLRAKKNRSLSLNDAAEALRELLDDAVKLRCISDVPMGVFLSGGLDSATIAASMRATQPSVQAFSLGFENPDFDESGQARDTARYLDIKHYVKTMNKITDARLLEIAAHLDEPLADTSFFPCFELAKFAREKVTVALGGDGADELFAGYATYVADALLKAMPLPSGLWRGLSDAMARAPHSRGKITMDFKLRQFLAAARLGWPAAHTRWRQLSSHADIAALLAPDWQRSPAKHYDPADIASGLSGLHILDQAMAIDLRTWLADDILVKVDRASMASSLEARSPFLDHRIMEFAASLKPSLRLRLFEGKRVLKQSQRKRLPAAVLARRKQGFNAPFADWFSDTSPRVKEILMTPVGDDPFNQNQITALWESHRTHERDYHLPLLTVFSYRIWAAR